MTSGGASPAARGFHALADETRLRIVERLRSGERCVCELTDALEAGQSRLSFHLRILKEAGILRARRQGRWVYYALNPGALDLMAGLLRSLKPSRNGTAAPARGAARVYLASRQRSGALAGASRRPERGGRA